MIKSCRRCLNDYEITKDDLAYYDSIDVTVPKMCPECRLIRRLHERNTRKLAYRKCDFTSKNILSQYSAKKPFPVYHEEIWWSDKWDALDYGQDFDFSRSFFEQFKELKNKVPHIALYVISGTEENSDYTNCTGYLKNCYLISEADYNEDCYYSNLIKNSKNLVDCSVCYECELCYECIDCSKCYGSQYLQDCSNCQDSFFLKDCSGCKNCIGCINQRNKQYMIYNQKYSKEEYFEKIKEFGLENTDSRQKLGEMCEDFFSKQIKKNLQEEQNQNSIGDHLYNSKNAEFCFDSKDLEDCKYCARLSLNVKNCMDYNSWGDRAEKIYYCSACGDGAYNLRFCTTCTTNISDLTYCDQCAQSSNLFGCMGVRKKKFCILNKQYTEEQYYELRDKIIAHMKDTGEWGEFFPQDMAPFAYNECFVGDYFPLSKEEALKEGYNWVDEIATPTARNDREHNDVKVCKIMGKDFNIIDQEKKFYEKMNIPVPEKCPDQRHLERSKKRNPIILRDINCSKCNKDIQTTHPPGTENVYCKECYLNTVY